MSVISDLFNGEIHPVEKFMRQNSRYFKLNRELGEKIEKFTKKLNKQENADFEEIHNSIFEMALIGEEERYIDGFCTGAKMMLEIMNYESENFK